MSWKSICEEYVDSNKQLGIGICGVQRRNGDSVIITVTPSRTDKTKNRISVNFFQSADISYEDASGIHEIPRGWRQGGCSLTILQAETLISLLQEAVNVAKSTDWTKSQSESQSTGSKSTKNAKSAKAIEQTAKNLPQLDIAALVRELLQQELQHNTLHNTSTSNTLDHSVKTQTYVCSHCGKVFKNSRGLQIHVGRAHKQ